MDETLGPIWETLGGRIGGPFTLRVVMQPLVASILAIRAGIADGRAGRPPYGWAMFIHPEQRRDLLSGGWRDVSRVFVLALVLDCAYQVIVFRWIQPIEALGVAFILSCIPYLLVRGPANRLAHLLSRP